MDQKNGGQDRMGANMGTGAINDKWTLETGWTGDGTGQDGTEQKGRRKQGC